MAGSHRHIHSPDGPFHGGSIAAPPPFLLRCPEGARMIGRALTMNIMSIDESFNLTAPVHARLNFAIPMTSHVSQCLSSSNCIQQPE